MGTGQQARLLFFQPGGRLFAMALGTMPVAAGMIGITELCAVVALCHMAAEKRGATKFDVAHHPEFMRELAALDRRKSLQSPFRPHIFPACTRTNRLPSPPQHR